MKTKYPYVKIGLVACVVATTIVLAMIWTNKPATGSELSALAPLAPEGWRQSGEWRVRL